MPKLIVFSQVTLDGYFADADGGVGWAHKDQDDAEWHEFVAGNANAGGLLLFGRITYELMASFWPTPFAVEKQPILARQMNQLAKVVFSRTLDKASWNNTRLVKGDMAAEVRRMKGEPGKDMAILGSGSIAAQLASEGLIDEFQIVVNPILLGKGRTLLDGIKERLALRLTSTRSFGNGNVLLCYEPAA